MWIHTLVMCKSKEFASTFPLPNAEYTAPGHDLDLRHLLWDTTTSSVEHHFQRLLSIPPALTPSNSPWISNVPLLLSWARSTKLDPELLLRLVSAIRETTVPLSVTLNRLLVWSIFLGSPVEEEALKIQDKSYDTSSFA